MEQPLTEDELNELLGIGGKVSPQSGFHADPRTAEQNRLEGIAMRADFNTRKGIRRIFEQFTQSPSYPAFQQTLWETEDTQQKLKEAIQDRNKDFGRALRDDILTGLSPIPGWPLFRWPNNIGDVGDVDEQPEPHRPPTPWNPKDVIKRGWPIPTDPYEPPEPKDEPKQEDSCYVKIEGYAFKICPDAAANINIKWSDWT